TSSQRHVPASTRMRRVSASTGAAACGSPSSMRAGSPWATTSSMRRRVLLEDHVHAGALERFGAGGHPALAESIPVLRRVGLEVGLPRGGKDALALEHRLLVLLVLGFPGARLLHRAHGAGMHRQHPG